ncbi:MAG: DUF1343 domain-containing protein [Sphaerochaeta sp.]|jgi:uncharacterized protein YbbC (DUF1343 family)|nr:DUF1343 domain-containing protein [Sphaerochaeta sp.]
MIRLGVDRTEDWVPLVSGKRVGLVCSPASVTGSYQDDIAFISRHCTLTALFGPEHGVRGESGAGVQVGDAVDPVSGLPVYSLYHGENTHLDPDIRQHVDVLLYDIQDLGLRFYTYIATLKGVLRDAAQLNLPVMVLDRPNPLGGMVYGAPLDPSDWSFVGPDALPVRYGMTAGELARWYNEKQPHPAELTVIRMQGWRSGMLWPQTGRNWIPTSPAIGSFASAFCYAGFCLLEGTNLSEGRGTSTPFQLFGSPYLDADGLAAYLNDADLPGLRFVPRLFRPDSGKFQNETCNGVFVVPVDLKAANPVKAALLALAWIAKRHEEFSVLPPRAEGVPRPLERLMGKRDADEVFHDCSTVVARWDEEGRRFAEMVEKGRLYAQ